MIYTMGHKVNYLAAIAEYGTIMKTGRTDAYQGGIACRTREDAEDAIREIGEPSYAVFGVDADWDKDTEPSQAHRWHDLLKDAPIVVLEGE